MAAVVSIGKEHAAAKAGSGKKSGSASVQKVPATLGESFLRERLVQRTGSGQKKSARSETDSCSAKRGERGGRRPKAVFDRPLRCEQQRHEPPKGKGGKKKNIFSHCVEGKGKKERTGQPRSDPSKNSAWQKRPAPRRKQKKKNPKWLADGEERGGRKEKPLPGGEGTPNRARKEPARFEKKRKTKSDLLK